MTCRRVSTLALAVALGTVLGACGDDASGKPDSAIDPNDTAIQAIQSDTMPACDPANSASCVELQIKGVVVTAIDTYGSMTGDLWVEESGGGPYSGVRVAPGAQLSALAIGDVVDVTGAAKFEVDGLTLLRPLPGGTLSVTKVSSGAPIEPDVVNALAIGQLVASARDAEWEKWEGTLIRVDNVYATSGDACVDTCSDTTLRTFAITGDARVESSLAAMPTISQGACLASVTGVLDDSVDYRILPRATSEIGGAGSACPPENSASLCGDGIDNDGNGVSDCADVNCLGHAPACATIRAIQMGSITGAVTINEAYVIARDEIGAGLMGLWVADGLQGASYNGVYVYTGNTTPDVAMVVGAKIKVQGTTDEFDIGFMGAPAIGDTLTQIESSTLTLLAAPAAAPTPLTGVGATTLSNIAAAGEPYEGVLARLSTMEVLEAASSGSGRVILADTNGLVITMDTESFAYTMPTVGTCYATVTGVMHLNVFDNERTINPRSALDMVVGTGCN